MLEGNLLEVAVGSRRHVTVLRVWHHSNARPGVAGVVRGSVLRCGCGWIWSIWALVIDNRLRRTDLNSKYVVHLLAVHSTPTPTTFSGRSRSKPTDNGRLSSVPKCRTIPSPKTHTPLVGEISRLARNPHLGVNFSRLSSQDFAMLVQIYAKSHPWLPQCNT
jgi:hypothetical protein